MPSGAAFGSQSVAWTWRSPPFRARLGRDAIVGVSESFMPRWFITASVLVLAACAGYQSYPPIPAPQAERVPEPPRSRDPLIWQPGHYDWNGAGFTWTPGRWVQRAGHGTLWQDGYWRSDGNGYAWVLGHWM